MTTVAAGHCAPLLWVNEDPLWAPLAVGPPEYLFNYYNADFNDVASTSTGHRLTHQLRARKGTKVEVNKPKRPTARRLVVFVYFGFPPVMVPLPPAPPGPTCPSRAPPSCSSPTLRTLGKTKEE